MLNELLKIIGHSIIANKNNRTKYRSPFNPNEKTPSFFVFPNNQWDGENPLREFNYKCNSTGNGGNIYDFMMRYYNLNFVSAKRRISEILSLDYLEQKKPIKKVARQLMTNKPKNYKILSISSLNHTALNQYLENRQIFSDISKRYLSEISYSISNKNYFAIAFVNNSGGMEVRNKYFKGCFGKKDISLIAPFKNQTRVKIFEGFFDFLSYIEIHEIMPKSDYLILNSLSLLDGALEKMNKKYKFYDLYLDNDRAGDEATNKIMKYLTNKKVSDKRFHYKDFKDLNEFWVSKKAI